MRSLNGPSLGSTAAIGRNPLVYQYPPPDPNPDASPYRAMRAGFENDVPPSDERYTTMSRAPGAAGAGAAEPGVESRMAPVPTVTMVPSERMTLFPGVTLPVPTTAVSKWMPSRERSDNRLAACPIT